MLKTTRSSTRLAVTLMELLVVVLILSILATIATGVYSGETRRARMAAARDLIHQLDVAITRYEVDLGVFPPSGSGPGITPGSAASRLDGSGFLHLALVHSLSGNAYRPASALWRGPYINLQTDQFGATAPGDATSVGLSNILDPWGMPIFYIENADYGISSATFSGGSAMFVGGAPTGSNADLPAPNPFVALGETYYNTSTYQLISFGPDIRSLGLPYAGAAADDLTNWGY